MATPIALPELQTPRAPPAGERPGTADLMYFFALNNRVGLPALGLGVFQTPPDETRDAVRERCRRARDGRPVVEAWADS